MPEVPLSLRQEAEVVTDLARGRGVSQTASRRHLPGAVVEASAKQHGATPADWTKASRELNRRLRLEADDLELDAAAPAVNGHDETVVIDGPVLRSFGRCSWTGCGHDYLLDSTTPLLQVQAAMDEHGAIHRKPVDPDTAAAEPAEVDEPAAVAVDDPIREDERPGPDVDQDEPEEVETATVPLAVSPDSIEFLLEAGDAIGGEAITTLTGKIRLLADKLRTLIDEHHATNRRRVEILAELTELETREQQLWAELLDLGGDPPAVASPDASGTLPASLAAGVWWQLPKDVRAKVRPWAAANDVPHGKTGRQPDATVEAYLAAHPEEDPRRPEVTRS